jgi:hypothetical protein
MRKAKTGLLIIIAAVFYVLFSCADHFSPEPKIPSGNEAGRTGILAPDGLKASQGEKRSITLSWNQNSNAALYYIYRADSPLDLFIRCGETDLNQFNFNAPPGSTVYYRVSSVSHSGEESRQSVYVRGTSLAQPVISDITDITESSAIVTWYMENAFEDSYKNNLLYTVYCFNGTTEIAQVALDGAVISENRAVFTGLTANTQYEYQVEAYLRGDQSAFEKSDKMDAATARRFRPGSPLNLRASRGTTTNKITVSFELPDMVDIALGDNLYDPKPVRFVISKRFYSESGNNEYQTVCSYFGSIAGKGETFPDYIPGATVVWSDENVSRGIKYEYQIQSYVDDTPKIISSDASKSSAAGWALSDGNLSFGKIEYKMGTNLYVSAKLPLDFMFDPQEESYDYELIENIEPLNDGDTNDPFGKVTRKFQFNTYDDVRAFIPEMDLTRKTTEDNSGRGLYSYMVEIRLNSDLLDTISMIGKVEVSENTDPIIVENFHVQDGYTNKFVLTWDNYSNRKYVLYLVNADGTNPVKIGTVNDSPTADAQKLDDSFEYTGVDPGVTRYFAIRPIRVFGDSPDKEGQMVYAGVASQTLGVPRAEQSGELSYSTATVAWTEAQKADTYRVRYWYTDKAAYRDVTIGKNELSVDTSGKFKFTFNPEGNEIDIAKAGLKIQIQVDALNEDLRMKLGNNTEISTSSAEVVETRLVGPAELGLSVSKAVSAQEINASWNKISGASGYYVFRRQFNMTNTVEGGTEHIVYYVPALETATISVTGKNMALDQTDAKVDTTTVKAAVSFAGSRYTLRDIYMPDGDYSGISYYRHIAAYRDQQNDMAQGYPYRYWVVPVINDTALNSINFVYSKDSSTNKNADISYYTIQENSSLIKYTGAIAALEKNNGEGFTIGFGQNVTAAKGTYASSGNVNDGIRITWSPPPRLSTVPGFNPRYIVYRKASGGIWETVKSDGIDSLQYIDVPSRGIAYEYVIGITNGSAGGGSDPRASGRFIEQCYTQRDERNRPKMLGFMLDMVEMQSVSRRELKVGNDFAEEVNWVSAGIKNSDNTNNNWGIDGYEVYVMNRNVDTAWHLIKNVSYNEIPDQIAQSVYVTNNSNLLKVLRDYKHYFKVRSYVLNDDNDKIYCPDPPFTYQYWLNNSVKDQETKYVKWGARQISADEFIQISTLYMAEGIERVNGTAWNTGYFGRSANSSGNYGASGSLYAESNFGVTSWELEFRNYRGDLQTRAGDWQTFITIQGGVWAGTGASNQYPQRYGWSPGSWGNKLKGFMTITGPSDTPGLYSGKIAIGGGNDLAWGTGGFIYVNYPTANMNTTHASDSANPKTPCERIPYRGQDTPLVFTGQGDKRYQQETWR